jgi:hypothetical protein
MYILKAKISDTIKNNMYISLEVNWETCLEMYIEITVGLWILVTKS